MLTVFKRAPDWCATSPHTIITRSFTIFNPSPAARRTLYLSSSLSSLLSNRIFLQPFRSPILYHSYSPKFGKFSPTFFTSRPPSSFFTSNVGSSKVAFNGLRLNSTNTAIIRDTLTAKAAKSTQSTWQEARKLLVLAKPESKPIGMAIVLLLISSGITMSVPFSMGKIIDTATNTISTPIFGISLPTFFAGLAIVFSVGAAANTGRVILFRITGERIIQRLRNDLYRAILRQEMSFFDRERSGDLISRLTVDTNVVGKSLTQNISDGLRSLALSVAGISMMTYVSPQLTGIMMLIVPPIAVFAVFYGRYVKDLSKKTQTALGEITKVAEERIGNIRTVQAFAKEDGESNRYQMRVQDVFKLAKKEAYASGLFFGGAGLSGNLTILAVLWYGGSMVMNGEITIGDLTSFMLFTAYVGSSLAGLTSFYSEVMKGIGAGSRVFEILERQTAIPTNVGTILPSAHGKISFDNISFHYPTRPQSRIFDKISFTVEPGTVVAICGPSGSGKSTIGSLILRLYDPTSGTIRVSDTSISQLNLRWWRQQVGLVSQEPVLFAGTIAENIAYGNEGATRKEIEAAAVKANCAWFINGFEKGYDTFVGERGISLSGGQKQRIAIARALLKDPSVLILDEATSALDAESEFLVQEALDRLMEGRTVFTIAHRISTIKNSDYIVCLNDAKVAEIGTYDELVKKNGVFKRLVEHQLLA